MTVPPDTRIRPARPADLDAIHALEQACFTTDRQSRRSLRHLLTEANALSLLAEDGAGTCGYIMLLLRRNSDIARLYSIAVQPRVRGTGIGRRLVQAAERAVWRKGGKRMRLELRVGNAASRRLFAALDYTEVRDLPAYYPDGEDGLRLEKSLSRDR